MCVVTIWSNFHSWHDFSFVLQQPQNDKRRQERIIIILWSQELVMVQKKMLKGWEGKIDRLKSHCCCCAGSGDITNYARRILMTRYVERRKERMKMEKSSWTFFSRAQLCSIYSRSSLSRSQHQHLGLIYSVHGSCDWKNIIPSSAYNLCWIDTIAAAGVSQFSLVSNSILLVFYCNQTVEFYHSLLLLLTKLCARVGPVPLSIIQ